MTIRPGEEWGVPRILEPGISVLADDAAFAAHVAAAIGEGRRPAAAAVSSGDLARALGGGSPGRVAPGALLVEAPIDVVRVETDAGRVGWFCAHLVAGGPWWRGELVIAANAGFLRGRDVAPRAHPDDGRVDVVRVDPSMGLRERLAAWRRAASGSHLPHPGLTVVQSASHQIDFPGEVRLVLDGRRWARARGVRLDVLPDAATVLA